MISNKGISTTPKDKPIRVIQMFFQLMISQLLNIPKNEEKLF